MVRRIVLTMFAAGLAAGAVAQENRGSLSAGFETNTTYYINDETTGALAPDGRFGSNNYLKLDYTYGNFSAGAQFEGYLPAIQGYFPMNLTGQQFYRYDYYAAFADKGWDVRIGTLFEQFGSGLLFRTYEDRTLGINNALRGIRVGYTFGDFLTVKGIYGQVRDVQEYSSAMVSGADLSFSLARVLKMDGFDLALEGSVLDKYESLDGVMGDTEKMSPHITGYSGRLVFGYGGFQLRGEYMFRDLDSTGFYSFGGATSRRNSEAIQIEAGYSGNGFGALLSVRKLNNPFLQGVRSKANDSYTVLNYVPALTQQHSYMLATLNPYTSQSDEIGGQLDVFYNFKRNTVLGGRKGMKLHANFSNYYGALPDMATGGMGESGLLFRDLTVDVERWFGKDFKMILFYSWQTLNPETMGKGNPDKPGELWQSHAVVADMTYKFDRRNSLRMELQHMYSQQDHGSWAAALLEYNMAPRWSISIQDMWNYGDTKTHYVNGSLSYSYSKVRCALNVGRFKEGYLCSGGVCRLTPAYTGANLSLIVTL